MTLLADRFLRQGDSWFDIATAERVEVSIKPAGPLRSQIAWAEDCAMLVRLRHALLNPLIDFGVASRTSFFEAYAPRPALAVSSRTASRLVTQAQRFLDAHGIRLTAGQAAHAVRALRRGHGRQERTFGIVLQPRAAYDAVGELFASPLPGGTTTIRIGGEPGSGLRTLVSTAARLGRGEGYVVVCVQSLVRWPQLLSAIADRHVCLVMHQSGSRAEHQAIVALLSTLAFRSVRPHVSLEIRCGGAAHQRAPDIHLQAMGITSMTTMTYRDPDYGPSEDEILAAASCSQGLPGRFVAALRGSSRGGPWKNAWIVHESAAPYEASPADVPAAAARTAPRSRIGSALWRAPQRAAALEARGRHMTASRLLARAARAFQGRGEGAQGARCWLQLGWIARKRGSTASALEHAESARSADTSADTLLEAGLLTAVLHTDEVRLEEGAAALRSLLTASEIGAPATRSGDRVARCTLALARVLCCARKSTEALETVRPLLEQGDAAVACEALVLTSRAHRTSGDVTLAVRTAREAVRRATAVGDSRLLACAHREMAEALSAAGDVEGVRAQVAAGLRAASAARLPLAAVKLRVVLLRALSELDPGSPEKARVAARLQRALRRPLPALVRSQVEAACKEPQRAIAPIIVRPDPPGFAHVEAFLDIAQRAKDDLAALADVAAMVCDTLTAASTVVAAADGRVIAGGGRPWRDRSVAVTQALTSGRPVFGEDGMRPIDVAEPIRCGGELVGALGCRWAAGVAHPADAPRVLRAAAMAIATPLRAVVDAVPGEAPAGAWSDLLGESAGAVALREAVHRASRAPFPVLIEGESGSGKELVARAIHRLGSRHVRRFCAINCAALSDELLEAELFGHTRGAYTGAVADRAGLFEEADGGTLFLDEVGELSPRAQAKLLRVIQEGEVRRIGENLPRRVDVRIVAATNRRLELETAQGRFRADLRFRLDVLRIAVPPLRDRIADIPILAQHFWQQACARVGSSATLGPDALATLSRYDWPGNVRELQNAIAWLAVHAPRRGRVSARMLPPHLASQPLATGTFEAAREEFERRYVRAALAQAGGQRRIAARALGISRQGLAKMMRRLRIEERLQA